MGGWEAAFFNVNSDRTASHAHLTVGGSFWSKKGPIHTLFTALAEKRSKTRGGRGGSAQRLDFRPSQAAIESKGTRNEPVSCDFQMLQRVVRKLKNNSANLSGCPHSQDFGEASAKNRKKCGTKGPHLAMYHAEVIGLSEPKPARKTIDRLKQTHLLDDRPWVMSERKLNG